MKKITTTEMIEMIRNQKGCTFATIESNTDPKAKASCPFKKVEKITRQNVMIGFDYENAVNNQRSREEVEAEFKSAPRRWGKRVDLKTVEHKGAIYLTTATLNHYSTVYKADGELIETEAILPHLPKKYTTSRQGLEKKIIYRDFKAENIQKITINGEKYEVY